MAADFMRIGDVERDEAVNMLREHHATGRLTSEEFDDRMSKALAARTQSELNELFLDLPAPKPGSGLGAASNSAPPFSFGTPEPQPVNTPVPPPYGSTTPPPYSSPTPPPYEDPTAHYGAPPAYGALEPQPYGQPPEPAPYSPSDQVAAASAEKPWYAQWWIVIVAVLLAGALDSGFIIVMAALWVWVIYPNFIGKNQRAVRPSPAGPPRPLTYGEREWVMEEVRAGNKIIAIKRYRELTGAGLKVAKETIEAWGRQIGR